MGEHEEQNINQAKIYQFNDEKEFIALFYTRKLTLMQRKIINFLVEHPSLRKIHKASFIMSPPCKHFYPFTVSVHSSE